MPKTVIKLRASGVGDFNDCARRGASRMFKFQIEKEGFALRQTPFGVAASIGTSVHKAAEEILRAKIDKKTGWDASLIALEKFDELVPDGTEFEPDNSTTNRQEAKSQIVKITGALERHLDSIKPKQIEFELKAPFGPGVEVTGHPDVLTEDDWIRDFKTGGLKHPPSYVAQLGTYSMLAQANEIPVQGVAVDYFRKVGQKTEQPDVQVVSYDLAEAEKHAYSTLDNVVGAYEKFLSTRDPGAFNANPSSMLCSPKYCSAWGTDFCTVGKPVQPKEEK